MKKIFAVTAASLLSTPAFAGVYLNSEVNNGYTGSNYTGRTVDLHIGYEGSVSKLDYYIQGGPALTAVADVDGTEQEWSGKAGGTFNISDKILPLFLIHDAIILDVPKEHLLEINEMCRKGLIVPVLNKSFPVQADIISQN